MNESKQAESAPRWTTLPEGVLHWESWGEQHAVFDVRSGETHLLPDSTVRLLRQLDNSPNTATALANALCEQSGETCDEQFVAHIARLLQQLHAVGLVERSAP